MYWWAELMGGEVLQEGDRKLSCRNATRCVLLSALQKKPTNQPKPPQKTTKKGATGGKS